MTIRIAQSNYGGGAENNININVIVVAGNDARSPEQIGREIVRAIESQMECIPIQAPLPEPESDEYLELPTPTPLPIELDEYPELPTPKSSRWRRNGR